MQNYNLKLWEDCPKNDVINLTLKFEYPKMQFPVYSYNLLA